MWTAAAAAAAARSLLTVCMRAWAFVCVRSWFWRLVFARHLICRCTARVGLVAAAPDGGECPGT
jgi:hypothetical protein